MTLGLLISDIHGVLEALEAVFETCPPEDFDFILNCGDTLVFGPDPVAVTELVDSHGVTSIRGNVDEWALAFFEGTPPERPKMAAKRWVYEFAAGEITPAIAQVVRSWPREMKLQLDNQTIHMVHGSPADFMEGLVRSTPDERLRELAAMSRSDLVICGHSHDPFARQVDNTLFINPGCVGRAFDGDVRASCAVLEMDEDNYSVDLLRVEYNWQATLEKMVTLNFPMPIRKALETGQREESEIIP
ncbi:MAG: metallophosphatase family protein [Lentisphaeria bacterium]|nr:metallophosphatase family protein [Candidatus Neomarinimicrobiota bacterium]MCF7842774.1 metallophosphatase family protein [Lentisphaeria bacterium]